ncbi:MAG: hypothetical protein U0165_07165 [Polyangiaceae bacterium]
MAPSLSSKIGSLASSASAFSRSSGGSASMASWVAQRVLDGIRLVDFAGEEHRTDGKEGAWMAPTTSVQSVRR